MNLKDIAKLAGVSAVTVSNVINGNHNKVSKDTIARIEKIIEENNYKPNATARSLAMKKSKIIGVIIPYLGVNDKFDSSPYYSHLLGALERYIRNKGYYMMTRSTGTCGESVALFQTWNIDGLIFLGPYDNEENEIFQKLDVPMVFIDSYTAKEDIANVGVDDYRGGYLSGKYLTGMGHKDIALISPTSVPSGVVRARLEGFKDACREQDVDFSEQDVFFATTFVESGVEAGQEIALAKRKYTAVATMSDIVAIGAMAGLRKMGLAVPDDVSVMGFDGLPESEYTYPRLTSIYQNIEEKAECAGNFLFRMIEGDETISEHVCLDVKLKEGDSVINLKGLKSVNR